MKKKTMMSKTRSDKSMKLINEKQKEKNIQKAKAAKKRQAKLERKGTHKLRNKR